MAGIEIVERLPLQMPAHQENKAYLQTNKKISSFITHRIRRIIMTTFEGKFIGKDLKIAIVVARFNEFITSKLLGGAMDGLVRNEVAEDDIDVYWVPGAFEIPFMTKNRCQR